ncbi:MAG: hypothetical protein O3C21_00050 [Verrucomicrobia bacterium]|nr:hypothetical protein [Verrucomicrobiota bacterium]
MPESPVFPPSASLLREIYAHPASSVQPKPKEPRHSSVKGNGSFAICPLPADNWYNWDPGNGMGLAGA